MMKKILISAAFSFALANGALAGDTVTITSPGGATQTISSSQVAAAFSSTTGLAVSNVTVTPSGGFNVSAGGKTFVVTSGFIATLLAFYS